MIVCIEGLSGTGKTSVAKWLCMQYGSVYLTTPPPFMRKKRKDIEIFGDDEKIFLYNLIGCKICSDKIDKSNGPDVVIDRYIFSTIAYNRRIAENYKLVLENIQLTMPDIVVLLHADENTRRARLGKLLGLNSDESTLRDVILSKETAFMYDEFKRDNWIEIDTSELDIKDVGSIINSKTNGLK